MIAFDDGDGAAAFQEVPQRLQSLNGPCQVFENKADKNVVERFRLKGQMVDISLLETNIGQTGSDNLPPRFGQGRFRDIHRDEAGLRAVSAKRDRLCAHSAACFQDETSCRVGGIGVKEVLESRGLILEAQVFFQVVTVDISTLHILYVPQPLLPAATPGVFLRLCRREPLTGAGRHGPWRYEFSLGHPEAGVKRERGLLPVQSRSPFQLRETAGAGGQVEWSGEICQQISRTARIRLSSLGM